MPDDPKPRKPKFPRSPASVYGSFSPYSKPFRPSKPSKTTTGQVDLYYCELTPYTTLTDTAGLIEALGTPGAYLIATGTSDRYDPDTVDVMLTVATDEPAENPHFDQQLADYEQELVEYKEALAWWKECKKLHDDYQKALADWKDRREYARLQKKFDNEATPAD